MADGVFSGTWFMPAGDAGFAGATHTLADGGVSALPLGDLEAVQGPNPMLALAGLAIAVGGYWHIEPKEPERRRHWLLPR